MENVTIEDPDLEALPGHLHEWARKLDADADRYQQRADEMKRHARILALKFSTNSILGEVND